MENLFNSMSIGGVLIRFAMDMIVLFILIRSLYFRYSKKENFLFTFFLIGIIVFFVCSMMKTIDIGIGMGFGLFAIFSILRFRTRNFSIKDMAYIFTTIGVSVVNSLSMPKYPIIGVIIINIIVLLAVFILEEYLKRNEFSKYSIFYDNIELLKPASRNKLLKDISVKTGRDVLKISIRNVDYKRQVAYLDIYYKENLNNRKTK
jgi:hypothetical protein